MNDLTVRKISYDETKPFILGIHYARRMPCVQYAFGLFDGDYPYPVGVVTYGSPASPPLCKGIAGEENRKRVLELNRLVLYPEYNGNNYASFLVAKSLKMLPHGTFVVSYADWGGVASHRICVPGHELVIHRSYKAKNGQVFRERTRKALRQGRNATANQDGKTPVCVSRREQARSQTDAETTALSGFRQVSERRFKPLRHTESSTVCKLSEMEQHEQIR